MKTGSCDALSESLRARVLERLQVSESLPRTVEGLRRLYAGWCEQVPFDNLRKLIQVRSRDAAPLPGGTAADFFENWLAHGTGGTCWAGSGALHALLAALDFPVERGLGTMLAAPHLPPNHGTVRVRLDGADWLLDTSILHGEPLALAAEASEVTHPAWGVRCTQGEGRPLLRWRPLHQLEGFDCRLEGFGHGGEEFRDRYEDTRAWSPFNYSVYIRRNQGDRVIGIAGGRWVAWSDAACVESRPVSREERDRLLVEAFGVSADLVAQLPEDLPTPPPPGSRTAELLAGG